jgi:hypothetical protein
MTGETEEVAAVVEEFVDIHARDERRRPLFGADEIDCQQKKEAAEDGPWQKLAGRDSGRAHNGSKSDIGHRLSLPG